METPKKVKKKKRDGLASEHEESKIQIVTEPATHECQAKKKDKKRDIPKTRIT